MFFFFTMVPHGDYKNYGKYFGPTHTTTMVALHGIYGTTVVYILQYYGFTTMALKPSYCLCHGFHGYPEKTRKPWKMGKPC